MSLLGPFLPSTACGWHGRYRGISCRTQPSCRVFPLPKADRPSMAAGRDGRICRVGPGNFTPSPSQIPDLILSHHPARVTARRLPPSAEISGSSRYDPVDPSSTAMTRPLCSTGITPLRHYYGAVRPSPAHRYFQPRGWSRLCFFPWHRRPGSHVPHKSQIELRSAYMPDAAWAVSVHPPSLSRKMGQPPVLTSSNPISTLPKRFTYVRLSQSYLPESGSDFSATFTTMAFDHSSLRWF